MIRSLFALAILVLALIPLNGCISTMVNRSAGGDMVWWCDVTQAQIGHPDTHIPGMTKYDPATGKDIPMAGVTQEEVNEALAERCKRREEQDQLPPQVEKKEEGSRFGWMPGVGKKRKEEALPVEATPAPEPAEKRSWNPFRRRTAEEPAPAPAPEPESTPRKSRWKFWQR
ncbi:MAG: hypothetical protein ACYTGH_09805 [Planctomycetota bacterium]|jgi:hypothetical protein